MGPTLASCLPHVQPFAADVVVQVSETMLHKDPALLFEYHYEQVQAMSIVQAMGTVGLLFEDTCEWLWPAGVGVCMDPHVSDSSLVRPV